MAKSKTQKPRSKTSPAGKGGPAPAALKAPVQPQPDAPAEPIAEVFGAPCWKVLFSAKKPSGDWDLSDAYEAKGVGVVLRTAICSNGELSVSTTFVPLASLLENGDGTYRIERDPLLPTTVR